MSDSRLNPHIELLYSSLRNRFPEYFRCYFEYSSAYRGGKQARAIGGPKTFNGIDRWDIIARGKDFEVLILAIKFQSLSEANIPFSLDILYDPERLEKGLDYVGLLLGA